MSPFVLVVIFTANLGTTSVQIEMPSDAVCRREMTAFGGERPGMFSSGPAYAARCVDRRELTAAAP
jgi:hypothetical protein